MIELLSKFYLRNLLFLLLCHLTFLFVLEQYYQQFLLYYRHLLQIDTAFINCHGMVFFCERDQAD